MIFNGSSLSFNGRELEALFAIYSPSSDSERNEFSVPLSSRSKSCQDIAALEALSRNGYSPLSPSPKHHNAALTLQKVYKSFRTRRQLADCAVLVE